MEVIEVVEREVEVIELIERGPAGPTGPQPDINYTVVSSARTLEAADLIAADTSGGAFTLTLPLNPSDGDAVDIFDFSETFDANPLTIARNGSRIESLTEDLICNVEGAYFTLIYTGSTRGWQVVPRFGTSGGGGESTLTTQGDMLYRGVGINTRLPIGSAGQILKVNSGATAPEWGAAPATGVTSVSGTAPIVSSGGATPTLSITAATTGAAGSMSSADKTKLDAITGTNTGDQTITLTGNVTGSGTGSFAATIANDAVDNTKLANMAQSTLKGRATASTGDPEDLSASSVRTLLNTDQVTDARTPTSHTHGNLTNDGKVGTTANLPLKTGTNGVVEAGAFGTSAGSFCEGNDARLSDDRDPNLHAASHLPDGADEIFDQSLNTDDNVTFNDLTTFSATFDQLTTTDLYTNGFEALGTGGNAVRVFGNGIEFVGTSDDTTRTNLGAAASGSITSSGLTQATARILGRTTASTGAIEEITIGSGLSLSAGELSATGSGVTAVGTTLADILSVSGSDLVADDLAADKLYGWDDSESKAIGFIIGGGLSVSGDTLSATASGGSKTYAVFTAEHNQPPATAFATLDTRNSIAVLDFDDATDESAVFVSIIPEAALLGSGLKIRLHWMATTATSGNVVWDVSLERMTTDLDSDSFDTIASGTAAANGTSGILTVTEITLTAIDSVTAGDGFRLKVTRDANNASDTMTGDAELVVCEVRSAA